MQESNENLPASEAAIQPNPLIGSIRLENIVRTKIRGRIAYQGSMRCYDAMQLTYVKPFDHVKGKGYQRPLNKRHAKDFSNFLTTGDDALYPPINLNAQGHWTFEAYDRKHRPDIGALICDRPAALVDGQHRIEGFREYIGDTRVEMPVPFFAFHYLSDEEERKFFLAINTKAKKLNPSLGHYLLRESDDVAAIATTLAQHSKSPFREIATVTGIRNKERHITLQNLYKVVSLILKPKSLSELTQADKSTNVLRFFREVQRRFPKEWKNYKEQRITHTVGLNALALFAAALFQRHINEEGEIDQGAIMDAVKRLAGFDWSMGRWRHLSGMEGSRELMTELLQYIRTTETTDDSSQAAS